MMSQEEWKRLVEDAKKHSLNINNLHTLPDTMLGKETYEQYQKRMNDEAYDRAMGII